MQKTNQEQKSLQKKLGVIISTYRKKAGYSQNELGKELGVSRQAVGYWERGETQPEGITLIKLIFKLNMDYDQLMRAFSEEALQEEKPQAQPEKNQMEEILERLEKLEKKQLVTA